MGRMRCGDSSPHLLHISVHHRHCPVAFLCCLLPSRYFRVRVAVAAVVPKETDGQAREVQVSLSGLEIRARAFVN